MNHLLLPNPKYQLKVIPRSPADKILIPDVRKCFFSSLPFGPDPITNVKLDKSTNYLSFDPVLKQLELSVSVSWDTAVGKSVHGYQVILAEVAAKEGQTTVGQVFALEKIHVSLSYITTLILFWRS